MTKQLDVWLLGSHIGTLSQLEGRLGFMYTAQWLDQAGAGTAVGAGLAPTTSPLSQSLPLRAEPFDDRATRPFYAGLLPRRCRSPARTTLRCWTASAANAQAP